MFDKRLLIVPALVVSIVVAGTIYLSSDQKASPLATEAASIQYSATIDVAHPLYATDSKDYYAFGLHNAGAYGGLRPYDGTLSTSLPAGYKNYAFSWTASASKPFNIYIENWSVECKVGGAGEVSTLWGIPNARKVELVYNKGGGSYSVNARPIGNWSKKSEETDPKTNDVTVTYEDDNSPGDNSSWSVSMSASSTIYIRSMTIWYLC